MDQQGTVFFCGNVVDIGAGRDEHHAAVIDGGLAHQSAVGDVEFAVGTKDVHAAGVLAGFKVVRVVQVAGEVDRSAAREREAEGSAGRQRERVVAAVGERRRGADRKGAERFAERIFHGDVLVESGRAFRELVVARRFGPVDRERVDEIRIADDEREAVHERVRARRGLREVEVEDVRRVGGFEERAGFERHLPGELAFAIGPELAAGGDGEVAQHAVPVDAENGAVGDDRAGDQTALGNIGITALVDGDVAGEAAGNIGLAALVDDDVGGDAAGGNGETAEVADVHDVGDAVLFDAENAGNIRDLGGAAVGDTYVAVRVDRGVVGCAAGGDSHSAVRVDRGVVGCAGGNDIEPFVFVDDGVDGGAALRDVQSIEKREAVGGILKLESGSRVLACRIGLFPHGELQICAFVRVNVLDRSAGGMIERAAGKDLDVFRCPARTDRESPVGGDGCAARGAALVDALIAVAVDVGVVREAAVVGLERAVFVGLGLARDAAFVDLEDAVRIEVHVERGPVAGDVLDLVGHVAGEDVARADGDVEPGRVESERVFGHADGQGFADLERAELDAGRVLHGDRLVEARYGLDEAVCAVRLAGVFHRERAGVRARGDVVEHGGADADGVARGHGLDVEVERAAVECEAEDVVQDAGQDRARADGEAYEGCAVFGAHDRACIHGRVGEHSAVFDLDGRVVQHDVFDLAHVVDRCKAVGDRAVVGAPVAVDGQRPAGIDGVAHEPAVGSVHRVALQGCLSAVDGEILVEPAPFEDEGAALVHGRRASGLPVSPDGHRAGGIDCGVDGDAAGIDREVAAFHSGVAREAVLPHGEIAVGIDLRIVGDARQIDLAHVTDVGGVDRAAFVDGQDGVLVD